MFPGIPVTRNRFRTPKNVAFKLKVTEIGCAKYAEKFPRRLY